MSDLRNHPDFAPERLVELWRELHLRMRHEVGRDRAEDVVQEAFLAAIERSPRDAHALRSWLSTVARRAFLRARHRDRDRLHRERAVARGAQGELPVEGSADAARIVALVYGLSDPYRTVLCQRYLEGLDVREIARRRRTPAATVRSQIQRGLDQVRIRLGLVPHRGRGRHAVLLGVLLRRSRAHRAGSWIRWGPAAACAAGLLALVPVRWLDPHPRGSVGTSTVATRAPELAPPSQGVPARLELERGLPLEPEAARPVDPWELELRGEVRDAEARAVAGVAVRAAGLDDPEGRVLARTDASGRFRIPALDGREWIWADDGSRRSNRHRAASVDPARGVRLDLAPAPETRAWILDADGGRAAGAEVTWLGEERFVRGPQIDAQGTLELAPPPQRLVADPEGSVRLGAVAGQWSSLLVRASGQAPYVHRIFGARGLAELEVSLPRAASLGGTLVDLDDRPVAGALLRLAAPPPLGAQELRTDEAGGFRFERVPPGPLELSLAGEPRPDLASLHGALSLAEGERREERFQLAPALVLRGRVISTGAPAADRIVEVERLRAAAIPDVRRQRTDARGGFVFPSCASDAVYAIRLLDAEGRSVEVASASPSAEEWIELHDPLQSALAHVHGRLESGSDPAVMAELWNQGVGNQWLAPVDPVTGAFEFQGVLPASYDLRIWQRSGASSTLDVVRRVCPAEVRDLGTLILPETGTLVVRLADGAGIADELSVAAWVPAIDAGHPRTRAWFARDDARREFRAQLAPGRQDCWILWRGEVLERRTILVPPGRTVVEVVDVPEVVRVTLELRAPRAFRDGEALELALEAGRIRRLSLGAPEARMGVLVPVGTTRIRGATNGALSGLWESPGTPLVEGDVLALELEESGVAVLR